MLFSLFIPSVWLFILCNNLDIAESQTVIPLPTFVPPVYWMETPVLCKMERRPDPPLPYHNVVFLHKKTAQAITQTTNADFRLASLPSYVSKETIPPYLYDVYVNGANSQILVRSIATAAFISVVKLPSEAPGSRERSVSLQTSTPTFWITSYENNEVRLRNVDGYYLCGRSSTLYASLDYSDSCRFAVFEVTFGEFNLDCPNCAGSAGSRVVFG